MDETKPKKLASRNIAITLGIICIILIALIAYFTVTGISAQNNYNNLQNQNKQLQTWLDGNETLLNQTQIWLIENETFLVQTQVNYTNLQNLSKDLPDILGLEKSTTWYNGTLGIPSQTNIDFPPVHDDAPYAGYVIIHASSPPTNQTVVDVQFYVDALGFHHDESANLGSDGTAIFPILPATIVMYFSDPNLTGFTGRTANVTITYYY